MVCIYETMNNALKNLLLSATGCVVLAVPAFAQQKGFIDNFGDWSAFADKEDGKPLCFMASLPKKSEGKYTQRGETYVVITHRPAEKTIGEISIRAGYDHKEGSEVEARIDSGQPYKLFTDGGYAWARDAKTDQAIVAAMKAGSTMIVTGTSARGTLTTDTYSLTGFTAAYNTISKSCDVK